MVAPLDPFVCEAPATAVEIHGEQDFINLSAPSAHLMGQDVRSKAMIGRGEANLQGDRSFVQLK